MIPVTGSQWGLQAHAFSWAESAMAATAHGSIADHYLATIAAWEADFKEGKLTTGQPQNEEEAVEFIRKSVFRQALQRNCYVERSTSQAGNFMKAEGNAFYATVAYEWETLYA